MRIENTTSLHGSSESRPEFVPPRLNATTWISSILAGYALGGGLCTLSGWLFGVPRLTDWLISGISMFANPALAAVCAGAALLFQLRNSSRARVVVKVLALAITFIGSATLLEHISGIDLNIDSLLVGHPWGKRGAIIPGRMGPPASISFALLGPALFFLSGGKSHTRRIVPLLGILVIGISLLGVIGYVFKANPLFATARLTGIAPQTATILLALGLALLARVPDLEPVACLCGDSAASVLVRRALPFLLLLPVALGSLFIFGRETNFVDRGTGTAMLVLALMLGSCLLLWWCSADVARYEKRSRGAESELQRKNAQLAAFLETAAVGLHRVGPDGIIQWANAAEMQMLGYSPKQYVGHHISEFHADESVISDILRRLSTGEKLYGYEARLKCKNGSIKHVLLDSSVLWEDGKFIHTQGFTRDITERKAAQQKAARLAAIIEYSDDAIFSTDLNGVIPSWNRGAERLYGYSAQEVIGGPIGILVPEGHQNEQAEILQRIRQGQSMENHETIRRRKGGAVIAVSLTISPVKDAKGQVTGVSKVARDITEKVRAREILEQTVAQRTASLTEALGQMEEFSYSVSHDLRAPVRAIRGFTELALEEHGATMPPKLRSLLGRVRSAVRRMDQLITDILEYSRVARADLELVPIPLDEFLPAVIRDNPELHAPRASIAIRAPLDPVIGHEPCLSQAVTNILRNAVKFVRPGDSPQVQLWTERQNDAVRLWIKDNGIGIDPKYHDRLFRLFERVHDSSVYEGTGIGLAIVRKSAEKMGGKVGVESDGISGSSFWIELPAVNV